MTTPPVLLRVQSVTKRFAGVVAVEAVALDIAAGEFFALLGGSGSGKSTLLRLMAGLEQPDAGRLLLDGVDITPMPPWQRPVSMMFQSYALFPHLSVFDNVAYGLRRARVARGEMERRVAEALALVGLEGFGRRRPHRLSGGQRQRVALARSLVLRPRLLLLDEPLAALDAGLRERTGFELRAIQRETGAAFVMVTHDQEEALSLADRIALLDAGRLVQLGPPAEVYARPATRFVARFLGAANVLEAREADGRLLCPALGIELRPAEPGLLFALRPERIHLAAPGPGEANAVPGTVAEVAFHGDTATCIVAAGDTTLRVILPARDMPQRGAPVRLAWEPDALVPLAA